jgi:hypothetical protein
MSELPCLLLLWRGSAAQVNGEGVPSDNLTLEGCINEPRGFREEFWRAGKCQNETTVVWLARERLELVDVADNSWNIVGVAAILEFDCDRGAIVSVALALQMRNVSEV